ncbi:MAG: 5-formyltetrahydrofolate cyclo-ligase [Acidiferrobacteraceae bacterium]
MSATGADSKRKQRAALRAQRRGLGRAERRRGARQLARAALHLRVSQRARRVACYVASDGEIDCGPLIALIRRRRKQCYLPVLVKWPRRSLRFGLFHPGCRLRRNRLGIEEPAVPRGRLVTPGHLDLVFTPLVGFDAECHRLGMGGGFYDRTLAANLRRSRFRRPVVVGLAYERQRLDEVVTEPWDVPLAHVVTEITVHGREAARPGI